MTPACLDDPDTPCLWDDDENDCPCFEPEEEPPGRPIDNVPTGGLL